MKASYFSEQFASALSYDRYLQTGTEEQQRRWTQVYDIARLDDQQQELLGGFVRQMMNNAFPLRRWTASLRETHYSF